MKIPFLYLACGLGILLASCDWSLPSNPPPNVTHPVALATFNKAKAGVAMPCMK